MKVKKCSEEEMNYVKKLFLEYANSLSINLDFQQFDKELEQLPGKYSEPSGVILLAVDEEDYVGCIALRKLEDNICEMKRLYVKPSERGKGVGKQLTVELINIAKEKGYKIMRLDTLVSLKSAVKLYKGLGFKEIDAYTYNPLADALYMELTLF